MRDDVFRLSLKVKELEKRVSALKRDVRALARALSGKPIRKDPPKASITDHLSRLKDEGWFSTPRTAADIRKHLEAKSFFYERTDLTHPLSRAVKKELLYRHRGKRCWMYSDKPAESK
jgi:hypothetical protein